MSEDVFAFRYGILRPMLMLLGLGPRFTGLVFRERMLEVRFGYLFRARIPYAAIYNARPEPGVITGVGVHGSRGSWLVNGSLLGIVGFDVDQRVDCRVLGLPVTLRHLRVSLADPAAFLRRLAGEARLHAAH